MTRELETSFKYFDGAEIIDVDIASHADKTGWDTCQDRLGLHRSP